MRVGMPAWRLLQVRGGVGNFLWNLLAAYRELAPDRTFVVYHDAKQPDLPHGSNLRQRELHLPLRRMLERHALWENLVVPLAMGRDKIDVVHGVSYTLPILSRLPGVVTVHDVSYERYPEWFPGLGARYLRRATRWAIDRAQAVVTDSEFSAREIMQLYSVPRERLDVVPLAADSRYGPNVDASVARRRYELPERFVLYVGAIRSRRNVDLLVEACAEVLPKRDTWLVVAGVGSLHDYDIEAHARDVGLSDRLKVLGYVPDEALPALYAAADVFAWPSVYEGFGLPPLEALACGTPTVVSDASSLPEVVGEAALRVKPNDRAALADALIQLLDDDALRRELAERGPDRAAQFSWRRTAEAMLAIYDRVAGESAT